MEASCSERVPLHLPTLPCVLRDVISAQQSSLIQVYRTFLPLPCIENTLFNTAYPLPVNLWCVALEAFPAQILCGRKTDKFPHHFDGAHDVRASILKFKDRLGSARNHPMSWELPQNVGQGGWVSRRESRCKSLPRA